MRADRLVAVLLLMQSRGRVTAGLLAAELEVSTATARRDLEALSAAGVPVYPQPGRGGGWSLVGGARTDLTGLTASEARALFLLVGPAAALSPQAKAALSKLVRALPDTFRADAEAASDAVVVDPAGWGERDRPRTALVDALQEGVVRRRKLRVTYATGPASARSEPSTHWGWSTRTRPGTCWPGPGGRRDRTAPFDGVGDGLDPGAVRRHSPVALRAALRRTGAVAGRSGAGQGGRSDSVDDRAAAGGLGRPGRSGGVVGGSGPARTARRRARRTQRRPGGTAFFETRQCVMGASRTVVVSSRFEPRPGAVAG